MMSQLTHFNDQGEAHMVDVSNKDITHRTAVATGIITMQKQTLDMIMSGDHKKGDVLALARIAGIMAAKKTSELVPLCHLLSISHIAIDYKMHHEKPSVYCAATVRTEDKTGVEMEALTAVQICLLTIYDMCKAVDRGMTITDVCLLEKSGGRSGHWHK